MMADALLTQIPPSLISSMVVASLTFVIAVWLMVHLANKNWKVSWRIGLGLGLWYALVFLLGKAKFFGFTLAFIPMIAFTFVLLYFLIKFFYRSHFLQKAFEAIPIPWLIGVQIFRVMGYGFLIFYGLGLIPGEFAIPTGWGDVVIGLAAPLVAYAYMGFKAKTLAIWWNYLGIADLALALTLGSFTYPRPFQIIASQPSNELIALFPLVMVPLFAVPLSILLHLFTLRSIKKSP